MNTFSRSGKCFVGAYATNVFQRLALIAISLLAMVLAWCDDARAAPGDDPLQSIMWTEMKEQFFGNDPVVFDDRVKVSVPRIVCRSQSDSACRNAWSRQSCALHRIAHEG